eukprot:snap_masked-scaffold_37-processed-gene-2.38-mRNA-1 protein AED:1.00 eAED:1.00 QI:0/0/0/0/1/1/2/0/306
MDKDNIVTKIKELKALKITLVSLKKNLNSMNSRIHHILGIGTKLGPLIETDEDTIRKIKYKLSKDKNISILAIENKINLIYGVINQVKQAKKAQRKYLYSLNSKIFSCLELFSLNQFHFSQKFLHKRNIMNKKVETEYISFKCKVDFLLKNKYQEQKLIFCEILKKNICLLILLNQRSNKIKTRKFNKLSHFCFDKYNSSVQQYKKQLKENMKEFNYNNKKSEKKEEQEVFFQQLQIENMLDFSNVSIQKKKANLLKFYKRFSGNRKNSNTLVVANEISLENNSFKSTEEEVDISDYVDSSFLVIA